MDMMRCVKAGEDAKNAKEDLLVRAKTRIVELEGKLTDAQTDRKDLRLIAQELADQYKLVEFIEGGAK